MFAILKLDATPVNINYRYRPFELTHILTDSGATTAVLDSSLLERIETIWAELPQLKNLIVLGDDVATELTTTRYEDAIAQSDRWPRLARDGSGEWLLYTGGTTGAPRAVITNQRGLVRQVSLSCYGRFQRPIPASREEFVATAESIHASGETWPCLPTAPLMHGAGVYNSLSTLLGGGPVVYLTSRRFDADETAALIEQHRVANLAIVGDVFALPLADALDQAAAEGHPYDVSSLKIVSSVGLTWSAEVKARLLAHGDFDCTEVVSATEGGPFARSSSRAGRWRVQQPVHPGRGRSPVERGRPRCRRRRTRTAGGAHRWVRAVHGRRGAHPRDVPADRRVVVRGDRRPGRAAGRWLITAARAR